MRHPLVTAAALFALAACNTGPPPASPAEAHAPPPAEAPAPTLAPAFEGELVAHGTEPFWNVDIDEARLRFTTPNDRLDFPNAGGRMVGEAAVWESESGGVSLRVTLTERPGCSDGMSDLVYPLAAEVVLGDATYTGCASKRSSRPTEGG